MMITYSAERKVSVEEYKKVLEASGIKRPTGDEERLKNMLCHANFILSAWEGDEPVGILRAMTDFCYVCYLADLAVDKKYQSQGIGKQLVHTAREMLGDQVAIVLLSAPGAMKYYPKIGLKKAENAFIIARER